MLKVKDLRKKFGSVEAVKGISLEIPSGKVVAFLGPNGAGKTTTMRMISGIIEPDSGQVEINGLDLAKDPVGAKRSLGFVPDRPYLYEKLTGREMVDFVLGIYGISDAQERRDRVSSMIETVGMGKHADQRIEDFSHGMKQRIAIACGLAHDPKLLVIDEPMVGLDPHGYKMLFTLLEKFKSRGGSVFLSTHTLADAQKLADDWAIIRSGELIPYHSTTSGYKNLEEFYFSIVDGSSVA